MKHILLPFLLTLTLSTSAKAQDACFAATDMIRLFSILHNHVAHNSLPEDPELRVLNATASRYTIPSIDHIFRQSPIANLTAAITSGFTHAEEIILTLSVTSNRTQPLYRTDTAFVLKRALFALGQLECSNPNSGPNRSHGETSNINDELVVAQNSFPYWLTSGLLIIITLSALIFGYLLLTRLQARAFSLTKRYPCDIPVRLNVAQGSANILTSSAKDISRSGVKIAAINDICPPLNSKLMIKIGTLEKMLHIRWGNAHYFGGQFDKPINPNEFSKLVALSEKPKVRERLKT